MLTAFLVYIALSIVVTTFLCLVLARNTNANVKYAKRRLKTFLLTTNEPTLDEMYAAEILLEYQPESSTLHAYAKRTGMDITPYELRGNNQLAQPQYFIA